METLISVGLESCLHYTCCVALSTFAPHVPKKPLCYNYTSLPVCPQLRHFPFVHNYVTPFLATTMSLPFWQQLCHFLSCPPTNYTPLPVRQQLYATSCPPTTIRHFLSAKKLYATSCPPRSYMPLSLPAHNYILPPTTISSHPQLYPPTHSYILPSTTVRRCLAHPPLVDKIRYTTTIYVTISAGHRRTKNRYRLVTSHNITSRGPPPGSKKIRYM